MMVTNNDSQVMAREMMMSWFVAMLTVAIIVYSVASLTWFVAVICIFCGHHCQCLRILILRFLQLSKKQDFYVFLK